MNIIPVIDIKEGQAVSAKLGQREKYKPLQSLLCDSSSIDDVIQGYLTVYPFKTLYIADLNAITETGTNQNIINEVIAEYQNIEFWIDNGVKIQNIPIYPDIKYKLVIGSESQNKNEFHADYDCIKKHILSLDFFPDKGYEGPTELIDNPSLWPEDIIIMTLDRVGQGKGPDIVKLAGFCQQYPDKNIIAAGGIRNEMDLLKLKGIGVKQTLIASALHSGAINSKTIKKLISNTP